jgi:hypothetical protein
MPRSRPLFACLLLLLGLLFFAPASVVHAQSGTPTPATATPTTPTPSPSTAPTVRSLPSIVPQLSVPIPGVNFTAPVTEGDQVSVPFLAQYINGIYSYMLGISTIVAIIVVIVGGFYYLLGATVGDARKGQTLIKDAVGGLVVLYASYFILYTVNPNLVSLRPLRLLMVRSVPISEGSGNLLANDAVPGGSDAIRCPMSYNQGAGSWARLRYGNTTDLLTTGTMTERACERGESQSTSAACLTTFSQSACGVTSLASVLGFYGLEISIPTRSAEIGGPEMRLVNPTDTAIYSILNGGRQKNNAAGGDVFFSAFPQYFPQFSIQTVPKASVPQRLREGHPILIACRSVALYRDDAATEPINDRNGSPTLYEGGHFMVLNGVVNEQILRIHDVGNGNSKTIRFADYQAHCGDGRLIMPRPNAPQEVSVVWGTGASQTTVQMRLNPSAGRSCSSSGSSGASSRTRGSLEVVSFNYQPTGSTPETWPANSGRAMFPARLRSVQNPQLHAFIYLHGNNSGNEGPDTGRYLNLLRESLERVAGSKNIVILTPHHNGSANAYNRNFDIQAFYNQAIQAVRSVMPTAGITDVVIGGHSGTTCEGLSGFQRAISNAPGTLRGVIVYDGCIGYRLGSGIVSPSDLTVPSGVALYFAPALNGMGDDNNGYAIFNRNWSMSPVPGENIPACVADAGVRTTTLAPQPNGQRQGGGELYSFAMQTDHATNVRAMTNIAFCALYRSTP